jgi:hypothetical protein
LEPEGNRGWLYTERLAYDDGPQVVEPRSFEAVVTPPPIVDREAVFVGLLRQAAARKFPTLPISEALERMAIEEAHYSLLKVEYPPAAEAAETTGTPF